MSFDRFPLSFPAALFRVSVGLLSLRAVVLGAMAQGSDWPQFLGPHRNNVADSTPISSRWPKDGPPAIWRTEVGQGFAGPVVAGRKLILFHRLADHEVVQCWDASTGRELWQTKAPAAYRDDFGFDEGPRATPAIDGDRVYTFGAEGRLACWSMSDGRQVWAIDTKAEFHQRKGFFGMACSPLVEGPAVILNVGGQAGAGIVAFDKNNGRVLWKSTSDEASYASPVAATIDGKRLLFVITREALVGARPNDGRLVFRHPWRPTMNASVSAASPLIIGDLIFISASYGTGATLLRFRPEKPEIIWSKDEVLSNHYATSVHWGGWLFGFDGRQELGCDLRCVEVKTGEVRWTEGGLKAGTVLVADGHLLVLTESGELLVAPAASTGFAPTGRAQILPSKVRAHPALAGGLFFARSTERLVCIDLRKSP